MESSLEHAAFDFVPIDLSRGDLEDLVVEVDVVFHLAAEPGVRSSWGQVGFETYVRNNVLATQHLLEAMRRTEMKPLVFASSSSVYGDTEDLRRLDVRPRPFSPYGVTKLSAEHLCLLYHRNFGLPATALRFFTVYGPRQRPDMAFTRFLSAALCKEPITIFGDGSQGRDFTYVGDVVNALLSASTATQAAGEVLNVGAGAPTALRDVVDVIERMLDRPLKIRYAPSESGDVRHTAADLSAIGRTLAWSPSTSLERGLEAQLDWVKTLSHNQLTALA